MEEKGNEHYIVPILFNRAIKSFNKVCDEYLKPYGLSKFHGFYLMTLFKHPKGLKLNDFNTIIGCDKANTSRAVADLEKMELVGRDYSTTTEKKFLVKLTEAGKVIASKFDENMKKFADKIFSCLDEDERLQLIYLMNKIKKGFEC